jgi:hypothetical protein
MNRKNLTAAVLAGLAGAAGIAGTAQAVNMNPDGLGQVLVYPYYTANDGNQTILSVVNTTDNAKAVKVRFLEGFNSREVLDFNLYLSHHDVWVAAIWKGEALALPTAADYETNTFLIISDDSCTVPYLYKDAQQTLPDGSLAGVQPFLNLAFTGSANDGGPESNERVSEGHFEMIEMGTIVPGSDTEDDITHRLHDIFDDAEPPEKIGEFWAPGDCEQLVENWTGHTNPSLNGMWFDEAFNNGDCVDDGQISDSTDCQAYTDTMRNSGGLFGGASVVHPSNGAMFSYDARAIQGFDKSYDGIHYVPGTIHPSLNDGDQRQAYVFFGVPQNKSVELTYPNSIEAVSAVFMHEFTMNEYTTADIPSEAATEWVITFPTKNFYVDPELIGPQLGENWIPIQGSPGCGAWAPGDPYPTTKPLSDEPIDGPGPWNNPGWEFCTYWDVGIQVDASNAIPPFTELYGAVDCELATLVTYDRDERTFTEERGGVLPPVVSPAPPSPCDSNIEFCIDVIFELCNEVNVLRFGDREIFGTPEDIDGDSLLITVLDEFDDGWGWIDFGFEPGHVDFAGLVGLPVAGFAAYQFENDFVENDDGDQVKAFYGGLFQHKGNVRRIGRYIDPQ